MTIAGLLSHRSNQWVWILRQYGFKVTSVEIRPQDGRLQWRATRPAAYGYPSITVDVREIWAFGRTAEPLAPMMEGHHLVQASWHAQSGGPGAENAERLDIDRSKNVEMACHRHPLGKPNHVREASMISTPEAWIAHLEEVIGQLSSNQDEKD